VRAVLNRHRRLQPTSTSSPDDTVTAQHHLPAKEVPWDQALDIILQHAARLSTARRNPAT